MLRLSLIWVDKTRDTWLRAGIEHYIEKIEHYVHVKVLHVRGVRFARKMKPDEVMKREAKSIIKALPKGAFTVALDVKGRMLNSPGFARMLTDLEARGVRDLAMVIGGASGLAPEIIKRADKRLSLSPMTFTHDMARLILVEQIYRACTIKAGEPYHH
ncbi:MAG: 23S rRNA (pseudouridine(1915)-N(3))-methyltransferase RlmH [Deltaproteobacteria bacterium]|nr:23S rRNA (pseudouridine(1915)-N(3))-methyltransferase RlmH [Deltaproteobacteria bacterium]MBW1718170.1 23S rRNA (pseudouridine(1915)-N(3))-methyltransferase RlmH [Deltaproteobacteria bacterium]MBW1932238.1 23S rRNA (pseudouridine(1915)-N(3))-methyltransferase RlmH [Deltaproteobacteria bacterium]MBW1937180.1 23S rRNA (pseudouridine(1915)-N(3))-methyltransferase RlmH [Deltaproteobacteria bacterium]MBW1964020.1 23S rRNA (pseudouridine(1915)-N(3))-methyltransferase RlmH [Deltaproteobacteria bact